MTTTAAQKKANICRWLGYQSDADDITLHSTGLNTPSCLQSIYVLPH